MDGTHASIRTPGSRVSEEAGVTLTELMVTLMVVGILIGIAAPTVQNHIALQELRGTAREVLEVLRDARDAAMNEGKPRYVLFSPSQRSYQQYRFAGGAWGAEGNAVPLASTVSFTDAGVTFPQLVDTPVPGATVPENAAYFDTRGRYPFSASPPASYTLTLVGGTGRSVVLTLHRQTGEVTGL